jgi:RNA polymerase sigma-70 factor, ECF subfamily
VGERRHGTNEERRTRFERLYRELSPRVLGYVLRRTDPEEARDVMAETFTVAWRRLEQVPAGDEALPWLLGTARKLLANRRRAAANRSRAVEAGPRAAIPDHADDVVGTATLVAAFNRLGEGDREALGLVVWDDLRPAEAAHVLGISAATFSVRLHRARKRLGAMLERDAVSIAEEERA